MTLVEAGVDLLVVDVANGHASGVIEMIKRLKADPSGAGTSTSSAATSSARAGAQALIDAGADGVKVGIGPGSICTTRVVAGVGVPQVTAIYEASLAAKAAGVPVIGDGGLQYSGDIAKALVAGADTVMLGSLLAGCDESPGGAWSSSTASSSSPTAEWARSAPCRPAVASKSYSKDRYFQGRRHRQRQNRARGHRRPSAPTADRWPRSPTSSSGVCGSRCSTSARTASPQLQRERGQFIRITAAGLKESHPHDIQMTVAAPNYGDN